MNSPGRPPDFDRQCRRRATLARVWEDLLVRRDPHPAHGRLLAILSVGLPSAIDRLTRHMDHVVGRSFNGRWQRAVWERRPPMPDLAAVEARSGAFIGAWRARHAVRIEGAPARRSFPADPPDRSRPPAGRLVFLRRTSDTGAAEVLGLRYPVSHLWLHRLVRAELDIDARRLRFFALRRRDPDDQPLLAEAAFVPPERWYR